MSSPILDALSRGVSRLFASPQLWLTIIVALAIFASFVFVADRFAGIARDAQERLINVRVGSLQDAFVPLAAELIETPEALAPHLEELTKRNPTIIEFIVATPSGDGWTSRASMPREISGNTVLGYGLVLSLAEADPDNSYTIEEADGNGRYFRTARAVRGENGEVVGMLITRQTLSEADRAIAGSIAESFLILGGILLLLLILFFHHARIIDYTELYRRLKEADQMKDDFVSMVSHELRSPLTIIRGYVAELKESPESEQAKEYLKRIDEAAEAQGALIGDILDVAKIEQGRLEYDMQPVEVRPIIEGIVEGFRSIAEKKGLAISLALPENTRIRADEQRIRQVLTNLVSNAIKYSDKGTVSLKGTDNGKTLTIRVSDEGIGMSAEAVKKLFGKFYRVKGSRVRQEVGTGLGLWITKQMVEAMGGTISVESIEGVGSHFIVSFPLASNRGEEKPV